MSRKTIAALLAGIDTSFPNNVSEAITPAILRAFLKDTIDTFAPGYGAASVTLLTLTALGSAPRPVTYSTQLALTPEFTMSIATGTITRLAQGLPSTVNRVSFYADLAGSSGDEFSFVLYRDGVTLPGGTTVTGQGAGNLARIAFNIALTSEDALDHVYTVQAAKITGAAANVDLSNVRFIIEVIPTLGI